MLPFFPVPYPDESFYSLIARYDQLSGNLSYRYTMFDLFNKQYNKQNWEIPDDIGVLLDKLKNRNIDEKSLIFNHTNYKYYSFFMTNKRRKTLFNKILNGGDAQRYYGMKNINLNNHKLRMCIECYDEDVKKFGEPYWHRSHQLPGVLICSKHEKPLYCLKDQQYQSSYFQLFVPRKQGIIRLLDCPTEDVKKILLTLAQESESLNHIEAIESSKLKFRYHFFLSNKNWYVNTKLNKFLKAHIHFYSVQNISTQFVIRACCLSLDSEPLRAKS